MSSSLPRSPLPSLPSRSNYHSSGSDPPPQSIHAREAQGDLKASSLAEIRLACSQWRTAYADRQKLLAFVTERLQQIYYGASIYVGRFGPQGRELGFFAASPKSAMVGQAVARGKPGAVVSIAALDFKTRLAVTPTSAEAGKLVHFGAPENFEYPYVVVPLLGHVDAVVGVLCADACEDPSADADDPGEALEIFAAVGMALSEAVRWGRFLARFSSPFPPLLAAPFLLLSLIKL